MQQIFSAIQSGSHPNRERLAADIEVTTKTIQRDIDFMRDRFHLPIAYDAENRGYFFTQEVTSFPMLELSDAEIVSVFIAQKALLAYRSTPFEKPLQSAYSKLISGLNGCISVPWAALGQGVSFRTFQSNAEDLTVFETIGTSVKDSKAVQFGYKKLGANKHTRRTVEPHHLVCVQGQWYCIALDRERKAWRNFALSRIRQAEMLPERFERDPSFNINTYLRESLGIFKGDGAHPVKLRFDSWAAQLIREREWHPGQQLLELPKGEVEFTLHLSSLLEIEPWILSWGAHVKVLAPVALKKLIGKTIAAMHTNISEMSDSSR
jgi:predicted DNA-binding transcriptional regulator YafY